MHLASLKQQCKLMRYMNSLNEWLGHDMQDYHKELYSVSDCLDQLYEDMNHLGFL
jgi:hypothetical protein